MKKIIIKIGGDMTEDLREIYNDPKKAQYGTHTIYLKDTNGLLELLSPKRIELLKFVLKNPDSQSITEISRKLKRKQEAISRDAAILESYNMIKKVKEKQKTSLRPVLDSIQIKLSN
ncbi:MAG: hypothetical protein HYW50_02790 [Candidatus Diapherotrites archaeon]|nr:hypothetical protein [Candidatus Diapherotrites archaeon]